MPLGVDFGGAGLLSAIRWAQIIAATGRPPAGGLGSTPPPPTFLPQRPVAGGFGPTGRPSSSGPPTRPTHRPPTVDPNTGQPLPVVPAVIPGEFERLLRRVPTEFEKLLRKKPLSDFERLLQRQFVPQDFYAAAARTAKTAARVLLASRVLTGAGALLYSAPAGKGSDIGKPNQPKKGPKARRRPNPPSSQLPSSSAPPRTPAILPQPVTAPVPVVRVPLARPQPQIRALPEPRSLPSAQPAPQPKPAPRPERFRFPLLLPTLLTGPTPALRIVAPTTTTSGTPGTIRDILARPRPGIRAQPLTRPQSSGGNCGPCSQARTRKERQRKCTNPRVSTKRETRGGSEFITITRKVTCPSSRKKRLSRPVP
jgi:hypothetical protein